MAHFEPAGDRSLDLEPLCELAFAHRIISDVAGQLILEEIERLTGPAELVPVESRAQGAYQLIPNDWGRTYLQYHRGIDMPGSFLTVGF